MAFQLTPEQEMIRLMARDFAKRELEPFAGTWDRDEVFPEAAIRKMGGLGLMGMMLPIEYGGAGAGAVSYSLALQEIAAACASTAVTMSVTNLSSDPILKFGSEEQKRKFLVPLARGEMLGAFAVTEPEAGSDPGSMTTRAEDRGDHYLVNGSKIFITNGSRADVIVLIVRTGSEKSNRGLSALLLTKGTLGFRIGRRDEKMGLRASDTVELLFDDCRIPKENLLAREGFGFRAAMAALADSSPGAGWIDRKTEFSDLFSQYRVYLTGLLALAVAVIAVMYLWRFRLPHGLICLVPTVLSLATGIAALGYSGHNLNLFSLLALILVLGIGINYTLFFTNPRGTPTTSMFAIFMAVVTTLLTFGMLVFSATQAISSFGIVLSFGILTAFLLSPLTLPVKKRGRRK